MAVFRRFLRIAVGLIFIASGFVKAVDTKGFSFKLEEYFSPAVFNMPLLENLALPIALFVVVLELLLGVALLLKLKLKWTLSLLIALCIFFAFLTFYSAYYNAVTDCGCFGDAIKFTPWESFIKDIILLAGLILLYFLYRSDFQYKRMGSLRKIAFVVLAVAFGIIIYFGIAHEPVIDFRDYKIGTDLNAENAKIEVDPSIYKTFYSLKNKKSGEIIKVNQDEYISKNYWEMPDWEIQSDKTTTEITKQGYASEILKFKIEDQQGNDLTETILKAPKAILIFSYAPKEMNFGTAEKAIKKMKLNKDALILGVSTQSSTFKTINNAQMDATAMKTIARSNPFILTLQNGTITGKSSAEDYLIKN